jgi:hypothetical protein
MQLQATPMFDGRAVCYPLDSNLRVRGLRGQPIGSKPAGRVARGLQVHCDTIFHRDRTTRCSLQDYLSWRQADTHINNQVLPSYRMAGAGVAPA